MEKDKAKSIAKGDMKPLPTFYTLAFYHGQYDSTMTTCGTIVSLSHIVKAENSVFSRKTEMV